MGVIKDFVSAILLIIFIIGIWVAVPIFVAFISTGLALLFFFFVLKEHREAKERDRTNGTSTEGES